MSEELKIPAGWTVERKAGALIVWHPDIGGYAATEDAKNIAATILYSFVRDLLASPPPPEDGWISVADRLPPPGRPVLVAYTTHHTPPRQRINRAHWIPAKFEEADSESDNFEYDEATDTNWTPAGWYECIDHWDDYSAVAMAGVTVTAWQPLPALPPPPAALEPKEQHD